MLIKIGIKPFLLYNFKTVNKSSLFVVIPIHAPLTNILVELAI